MYIFFALAKFLQSRPQPLLPLGEPWIPNDVFPCKVLRFVIYICIYMFYVVLYPVWICTSRGSITSSEFVLRHELLNFKNPCQKFNFAFTKGEGQRPVSLWWGYRSTAVEYKSTWGTDPLTTYIIEKRVFYKTDF